MLKLGPSVIVAVFFLYGRSVNGVDLPSARELKNKMLLLDSPPSLQGIKDSLVEAYRLEIEAADAPRGTGPYGSIKFYPPINRFNVDSYKKAGFPPVDMHGPWVIAQELRRDTYVRWSEILQQHGIDPAKEGLAATE